MPYMLAITVEVVQCHCLEGIILNKACQRDIYLTDYA
jgi:hypothetical protein